MKLVTEDICDMVFTRSRDVVTHMDGMAEAWARSDIMAFDENRLHAMQALHDIRTYVNLGMSSKAVAQNHGGESAMSEQQESAGHIISIDFEKIEEDIRCHHATAPHLLGEKRECSNCHNARMLARDLGGDESLLKWYADYPAERPGERLDGFIHDLSVRLE